VLINQDFLATSTFSVHIMYLFKQTKVVRDMLYIEKHQIEHHKHIAKII